MNKNIVCIGAGYVGNADNDNDCDEELRVVDSRVEVEKKELK